MSLYQCTSLLVTAFRLSTLSVFSHTYLSICLPAYLSALFPTLRHQLPINASMPSLSPVLLLMSIRLPINLFPLGWFAGLPGRLSGHLSMVFPHTF